MECYQFTLDLSGNSAIPSQYKIGLREVCKWISHQAKNQRDIQVTNHYHRGCYNVQTGDKKTAEFLKTFVLEINWNGKTHRVALKPSMPDKPRIWVRFWGTCRGVMAQLANAHFDGMLEAAGFNILRPTEKRKHFQSDLFNGQRSALCQRGSSHVEREHEWIDADGNVFKWRLEYDGQPHQCTRGCQTFHDDGKCATWERKKEQRSWGGQQKCFFVSSSMLRLAADTKETRIDAVPGAKVGHLANHINNDGSIFSQADIVVVNAGANMDLGSVEASKPHLDAQAKELVNVVKPLVDAEKSVFIVDPVTGPLIKEAPDGHHWAMVRKRMKNVAKETKAHWVSLQNVEWVAEEDVADDGTHYSKSGTQKVMETVGEKVKEVTGVDVISGMTFQDKPYEAIYRNHYKFGCYRCTRVHERGPCPPLPEAALDSSNNSNSSNDSSIENDNSIIEKEVATSAHDISDLDSWAESDDDATPTNATVVSDATSGASADPRLSPEPVAPSTSAAAAIAAYNEVASSGRDLLRNLNNERNRSTSASKRDREAEESAEVNTDKRKKTKDAEKKTGTRGGRGGRGGQSKH